MPVPSSRRARALVPLAVFALASSACDPRSDARVVPSAPSAPPLVAVALDAAAVQDAPDGSLLRTKQQRALFCLDDPTCPASEADRLFRAAADAQEDGVDCFRFADGDGTRKDLPRARACLERAAPAMKCEGSSAGLEQAELAMDRIDGVGGPVDIPGARTLFDGCFADITQQEILGHATAREANSAAPRVDFCKDYGGTTLTGNECSARARQHEATRAALQAKSAAATLDDEGKKLFAAASSAYASYASAMGSYVYEVRKDGSIRNAEALAEETAILSRRTAALAKFGKFAPGASSPQDLEKSARALDVARKKRAAGAAPPDTRAKIAEAESAWTAYRDAEIALYVHAFGTASTETEVRDAVLARLNKERLVDLAR
jgi:hypothetical protein